MKSYICPVHSERFDADDLGKDWPEPCPEECPRHGEPPRPATAAIRRPTPKMAAPVKPTRKPVVHVPQIQPEEEQEAPASEPREAADNIGG